MSILEVKQAIDELPAESLSELEAYIRAVKEQKVLGESLSREERFAAAKTQLFGEYDHLLSELAK